MADLAGILGKIPKGGGKSMPEPDADEAGGPSDYDEDDDAAEMSFVHEMMTSAKRMDAEGFRSALKGFIESCYPQLAK